MADSTSSRSRPKAATGQGDATGTADWATVFDPVAVIRSRPYIAALLLAGRAVDSAFGVLQTLRASLASRAH